jgi:phosphatidylserine/phosphatidylglycerophosphate/cardiolipin synthase-like enzyme
VPRYPDQDGKLVGPPYRIGQQRAMEILRGAAGDRVFFFDLEAPSGWPIYVHSKVCVIDDVWMIVGSDNLNLRSWTNDSEVSCAVIDDDRDGREPADPGGQGDGARVLARETRLRLWREHLDRAEGDDEDLVDGVGAIPLLRRSAEQLERWRLEDGKGPRPPGRLRPHQPGPVRWWASWWAQPIHKALVDPDGRPRPLRRTGRF